MNEQYSSDIIHYICETTGDNQRQVSQNIGLSESAISQIVHAKRNLTIDDLLKLENAYEIPIPLMFLLGVKDEHIPKNIRAKYRYLRRILSEHEMNLKS